MYTDKLTQAVADAALKVMQEELKGKQKVLDKNKNNKIDAEDLKILRKEESENLEEGWDDMMKAAKERAKPQPNGGAGKKQGTAYGGSKQKDVKEDAEINEADLITQKIGAVRSRDNTTGRSTEGDRKWGKDRIKSLIKKNIEQMKGEKKPSLPEEVTLSTEEAEQLDELNKSTLGSYVKKASHDVAAKGAATRQFANDSEAARKGEDYSEARKKMQMADKTFAKSWKRREGMAKAVDRLTKEEVEQLDELSKTTLGSYVKKAAFDLGQKGISAGQSTDKKQWAPITKKMNKRTDSIVRATDKLTKEDVDQVQERTLTEPEMKKREEVVKSMKKNVQSFKDRYGDRAKEVMYATATNVAKKD